MSDRSPAAPLIRRLLEEGHRFSFFQLVNLVLRLHPEARIPGSEGPARRETLRFRPAAALGFAPADVAEVARQPGGEIGERFQVTVNFMGLYGPASPMPTHLSEEILWADGDVTPSRDFLDIFHHRLISFVYRAWLKYRPDFQFRADPPDGHTRRMLCLVGLGTRGMRGALGRDELLVLRTAGLLSCRSRSAAGLAGLLRAHLPGVPIEIASCVARRIPVPRESVTRLGQRASRLGEDVVLGGTIRDLTGGFRVIVGPVGLEAGRRLLPGGEDLARLVRLVRLYVKDPLHFDVMLKLKAAEVPALRIGRGDDLPLGWLSWLGGRDRGERQIAISVRRLDPLAPAPPETEPRRLAASAPARPAATTTRRSS